MYYMNRAYGGRQKLDTSDLITAIKHASNYEADLYKGNSLIMSPLGLEHEDNAKKLAKLGVVQYYKNKRLAWKYEDETKNIEKLYFSPYEYTNDGGTKVSISVHDYRNYKSDIEFNTLEEVQNYAADKYGEVVEEFSISCFLDNELYDLKHVRGKGWMKDRMYYIIGIDSTDHIISPPQLLCVFGDNKEKAMEKYLEIKGNRLFQDEKESLKVFGTSRDFVSGYLDEYLEGAVQ